jgi:hypothetical protein
MLRHLGVGGGEWPMPCAGQHRPFRTMLIVTSFQREAVA